MKLLKTIERLIEEAEDRYFKASNNPNVTQKELNDLEKKLDDTLGLLSIYESIENT